MRIISTSVRFQASWSTWEIISPEGRTASPLRSLAVRLPRREVMNSCRPLAAIPRKFACSSRGFIGFCASSNTRA